MTELCGSEPRFLIAHQHCLVFLALALSLSLPQRDTCRGLAVCCRRPCSWTTCGRRWEWPEHRPGEKESHEEKLSWRQLFYLSLIQRFFLLLLHFFLESKTLTAAKSAFSVKCLVVGQSLCGSDVGMQSIQSRSPAQHKHCRTEEL